jgi:hypothetical protein
VTGSVLIPVTGQVVALDAPMELLAVAMDEMGELERDLRSAKREITEELARRLDHEGRRSMDRDGVHVEINAPTERDWNLPELQGVLRDLVAEGTISQAKADACIKWEPKAVWNELRTLLSDPRCEHRISHTLTLKPATRYAKVRRA